MCRYQPSGLYACPVISAPGVMIRPASTVELLTGLRTSTFNPYPFEKIITEQAKIK